ncbi:cupin domain-containing protein [Streptomyces sp. NBC_01465]|uniref:cupin domain-containing protein n=1 Tax=Streptomyces sp. NBC_01465 TaxID=2903878 RepID=UPI002E2FBE1A|nr:cupin domain-containing protein [Streptomyces sp. NBC_01465]
MTTTEHTQPPVQYVNIEDARRSSPGEGLSVRTLPATAQASSWVLDFAPGSRWMEVDHHVTEEHFYVLSGELVDGDRLHRAGDYVVMAAGTSHRPHTETGASLLVISLKG